MQPGIYILSAHNLSLMDYAQDFNKALFFLHWTSVWVFIFCTSDLENFRFHDSHLILQVENFSTFRHAGFSIFAMFTAVLFGNKSFNRLRFSIIFSLIQCTLHSVSWSSHILALERNNYCSMQIFETVIFFDSYPLWSNVCSMLISYSVTCYNHPHFILSITCAD